MANSFKTIISISEGFYKEKGSKFFAFAYPVENIEQAKTHIFELKRQYHDARHFCFAHIIGQGSQQMIRANDDGEPGHSAGDPILGQIRSFELTNTLVVVVRYFGGTKLGVSGLIHAYKSAAAEALQHARIRIVEIKVHFELDYPYDKTNEVLRLVNEFNVEIVGQDFQEYCRMEGKIDPANLAAFRSKLELLKLEVTNQT